ncbi:YndJ family transporter [Planococcus sp. N017]|uniref:YndJ family transporter n=1 Tax=Planococcus shenhongbingii TaxID=3058398 RepID=A0ABT8NDJ7_9BACL|nr:YndJ family transporter [Planococcus sp. N017]MDN7245585.1 YndJ family transporter [Planococcus sp. N017]
MTKLYKISALIIATGPMTVAIGITFSHTIEIVSVSLYVGAIYALTFYTFRLNFPAVQALIVRIPFVVLCLTILGSFLYAYGNFSGNTVVTIPDMLDFHGFLNCLLFGSFTVIGWALHVPATKQKPFSFPISNIRGKLKKSGIPHQGLVDGLEDYVEVRKLPIKIVDFYERTENFQLFASVKWKIWFKPLAFIYQFASRKIGQLNLPFSSSQMEMTGEVLLVDEQLDGRSKPRVWKRMIGTETVFVAIYSKHQSNGKTYMNIALPLPFSSMHGILQLTVKNKGLHLTSNGSGDAGTYLALGRYVFKLPLHENFIISERNGNLMATHDMTLFGLHFLHIDYDIKEKTNSEPFKKY